MKLPSGSGFALASICPPAFVLPGVDFVSAAAHRGTVFHEFLYNVSQEGIEAALRKAPEEYRVALGALDFDRLPLDPSKYAAEVSFAYDVTTGKARELGRGLSREEAKALLLPNEILGTADVLSSGDEDVLVLDYKTGWTDYGPIKLNWQVSFYALCAARAYGFERARIGIVRLREDGSSYFDMGELDFFDLEDIAFRIASVVESVRQAHTAHARGESLRLKEGEHCKRCPAMASCPAMVGLVRELAGMTPDSPEPVLTQDRALPIYEKTRAMRAALDRIETAVEAWAAENPIELPGGKVYGRHKRGVDVFVPEAAIGVLREEYGEEFTQRAVDITPRMTKEGIKKALRHEAQRQKGLRVEPAFRGLQDRLRLAGGLTMKFTYPVMVHKRTAAEECADEATKPPEAQVVEEVDPLAALLLGQGA